MEKATILENIRNYIGGSIDANGNVIVGDNNTIIVSIYKFDDYKKLKKNLENHFSELKKAEIAYKENPIDFIASLIATTYQKIETTQKEIESFEREIVALANDLTKITINTDRLKKAQEYFLEGKQNEARAFLESEKDLMKQEQNALLSKKRQLEKETQENENALINNSNEYLLLARLTSINFDLPDRIEKTKAYFEESILANKNPENLYGYAYFLQENKVIEESIIIYQESIVIYRRLAKNNPKTHISELADILNNLGLLHKTKKEYIEAEQKLQEALEIYRKLPHSQSNLSNLADILHNLGDLYREKSEFIEAEQAFQKALKVRRQLAKKNPKVYLLNVAKTLNNLGLLHRDKNEIKQAEAEYIEALEIYRKSPLTDYHLCDAAGILNNLGNLHRERYELTVAEAEYQEAFEIYKELVPTNPRVYMPHLAMSLNNLGILYGTKYQSSKAEQVFQESLEIRRKLALINPQVYLPDVAMSLINLSIFYIIAKPNRELSIQFVTEALNILMPFLEDVPYTQEHYESAIWVLNKWGINTKDIFKMNKWNKPQF